MKLVVGLGNPGPRYRDTRHNVGFRVVEEVARQEGWHFRSAPWWRWVRAKLAAEETVLAQPLTFMNDSGRAVQGLVTKLAIPLEELFVICDDLNLPLGQMRLRRKGSCGGHKGLASIARALASEEFPRLRLGIGAPQGDTVEFVLSEFSAGEREPAGEAIAQAADAVRSWATEGIEEAMNRFNRRPTQPQGDTCETV